MSFPVLTNAVRLSLTLAKGFWDLSIAQAPATCGAAMDVPSKAAKPPPGTDEVMSTPGARRLKIGALLEKSVATKSDFVVAPTLIALEMQAGAELLSAKPLFPEAMTVATPMERRRCFGHAVFAEFVDMGPLSRQSIRPSEPGFSETLITTLVLVTISVQSGHASGFIKVQHTAVPSNPQGNHTPNHPCVYRPQSDALALGELGRRQCVCMTSQTAKHPFNC